MNLLEEVKILCIRNGTNITRLADAFNDEYGENITQQSLYRKLKTETIKYNDMVRLLRLLRKEVQWTDLVDREGR